MIIRQYLRTGLASVTQITKRFISNPGTSAEQTPKQLLLYLRNKTGFPMIGCKEALKVNNYDVQKAEAYLVEMAKQKGWEKMEHGKQDMTEGLISITTHKNSGVMLELNCETDFVAKTSHFQNITKAVAQVALNNYSNETKCAISVDELLMQDIPGQKMNIKDMMAISIGKLKENILLRRASILTAPENQTLATYMHPGIHKLSTDPNHLWGTYGAIIAISPTDGCELTPRALKRRGTQLAQHIVGMDPLSIGTPPEPVTVTEPIPSYMGSLRQESENQDETGSAEEMISEGEKQEDRSETAEESTEDSAPPIEMQTFDTYPPDGNSDELLKQPFLLESNESVYYWLECNSLQIHDYVRFQVGEHARGK